METNKDAIRTSPNSQDKAPTTFISKVTNVHLNTTGISRVISQESQGASNEQHVQSSATVFSLKELAYQACIPKVFPADTDSDFTDYSHLQRLEAFFTACANLRLIQEQNHTTALQHSLQTLQELFKVQRKVTDCLTEELQDIKADINWLDRSKTSKDDSSDDEGTRIIYCHYESRKHSAFLHDQHEFQICNNAKYNFLLREFKIFTLNFDAKLDGIAEQQEKAKEFNHQTTTSVESLFEFLLYHIQYYASTQAYTHNKLRLHLDFCQQEIVRINDCIQELQENQQDIRDYLRRKVGEPIPLKKETFMNSPEPGYAEPPSLPAELPEIASPLDHQDVLIHAPAYDPDIDPPFPEPEKPRCYATRYENYPREFKNAAATTDNLGRYFKASTRRWKNVYFPPDSKYGAASRSLEKRQERFRRRQLKLRQRTQQEAAEAERRYERIQQLVLRQETDILQDNLQQLQLEYNE